MLSGRHPQVAKYMRSFSETKEFIKHVCSFLGFLIPLYIKEGKAYLTVGIGCTGGRHRSVFIVEELAKLIKFRKVTIKVRHRDEAQGRLAQSHS
jgi:UPF0042 nucleotide-binding protein